MADKHAEALCGLMDGELGESEARFLLRRLNHDQDLNARWARYHLARSAVRGDLGVILNGFAGRVSSALAGDSAAVRVPMASRIGWLKPLGGAALAASVALLAFTFWRQPMAPSEVTQRETSTLAAASQARPVVGALQATPASVQMAPGRWNPRLQGYLVRHNEVTAPRRSQGLVPYWYLVSEAPPQILAEGEPDDEQPAAED